MRIDQTVNVDDLRRIARRKLPGMIYDFVEGGSEDELTARLNREAFDLVTFRPSAMQNVAERSKATTIVGDPVAAPLIMGPAGLTRAVHPDGELAVAKAAGQAGLPFCITPWCTFTIEEIAEGSEGPHWFEVGPFADMSLALDLMDRARKADFSGVVFMVDSPVPARHERELRRKVIPPQYTLKNILDGARKPAWGIGFWRTAHLLAPRNLDIAANLPKTFLPKIAPFPQFGAKIGSIPGASWDHVKQVRDAWDRQLIIKGVISAEDAVKAVEVGADAIIVSNHGGRSQDGFPATLAVLPEVVKAVDGRAEIILDGGIRRGTDIAKALALGARAVAIGRPYHYGLAAGGQAGVERVIELLLTELDRTMGFLGCASVDELGPQHVRAGRLAAWAE
ncbi:MAG TPA: alpha-hydroxy acid oxidase [Acidimicrobiales bacterium]|nr:alpha-hydroxy acid oxidase [Acidimicrobiales bacterium]